MRYRLATLLLFAVLPVMSVLAAPAPDPSAILDIGPPPKGETAEQYRKRLSGAQTCHPTLCGWMADPEMKNLPSVARFKDPRPWLVKNLHVTEDGERRLRLTFLAGNRAEKVAILNALLRENLSVHTGPIKWDEECIRIHQKGIRELEERIKSARNPQDIAIYQQGIQNLRTKEIPACLADIARRKQMAVIKWAK